MSGNMCYLGPSTIQRPAARPPLGRARGGSERQLMRVRFWNPSRVISTSSQSRCPPDSGGRGIKIQTESLPEFGELRSA
jgi:hypothetical protein